MGNFLKLAAASAIVLAAPAAMAAKAPAKATAKAAARAPAGSIARIGGHPNFNGVWQVLSTANYNLEPHDAAPAPAGSARYRARSS